MSPFGYLVEALHRRHLLRLGPLTIVSCDNLVDNGARLARAVAQLADSRDRNLARWIEDEVRFPRTMVDSITPVSAGVTITDDVAAYDRAKLRLLNGAHSSLAYLGLLAGHETVAEAMVDTNLSGFVMTLMKEDIQPTLKAPRGLGLAAYIHEILKRFRNPAISHALAQIAADGSQKLPFRLLGTIADSLAAGRPVDRLCRPSPPGCIS